MTMRNFFAGAALSGDLPLGRSFGLLVLAGLCAVGGVA